LARLPLLTLYLVAMGLDPTEAAEPSGIRPPGAAAAGINRVRAAGCPPQTRGHSLAGTYFVDVGEMAPRRQVFMWNLVSWLRRAWLHTLAMQTAVDCVPGAAAHLASSVRGAGAYTTTAHAGAAGILTKAHPHGLGAFYRAPPPPAPPLVPAPPPVYNPEAKGDPTIMTPDVAVAVAHEILLALRHTENYFPQMLEMIMDSAGALVHPAEPCFFADEADREDESAKMPAAGIVAKVLYRMAGPDMVTALDDYRAVAVSDVGFI
jgi:hypothetical protein